MTHAELLRHLVGAFLYVSVLALVLLNNATTFDRTEGETLAQMALVAFAYVFLLWATSQRLRARWYVCAGAAFLVLLSLTCTRAIVGRIFASVAWEPGETDRQWGDRAARIAAERLRQ